MSSAKPTLDFFMDTGKPITDICPRKLVVSHENDKLRDILNIMLTEKYRKIPVVDDNADLRGIVTTIDVLDLLGGGEKYDIFRKNSKSRSLPVEKFMTKHVKAMRPETTINKAKGVFRRGEFGLYPVVKSKKLVSVVSEWDLVKHVSGRTGIRVYEAMVERPFLAKRGYTVYDVAKMMCRGGFRRFPVVDDGILVGFVAPSDILLHIYRNSMEDKFVMDKTRIEKVMNRDPVTIHENADLLSAVNAMKSKRVGGLPVVEEDELIGIITERDILEVLL